MTDKLTPWYPPHIKPVRVGVYETDTRNGRYQHWNGQFWSPYDTDPAVTLLYQNFRSAYQAPSWRGLADPPK